MKPPPKSPDRAHVGSPDAAAASPRNKTPARTDPLADAERGAFFDQPDAITGFHEYDGSLELDFPRELREASIGASRSCTFSVPDRNLSAKHAVMDRRGSFLRVVDLASTNGTYYEGRRVQDVSIAPGAVLTLASLTLIAMNDEMKADRPVMMALLGKGHTPSPDRFLVEYALGSSNLLIHGAPGCGQDELVKAVHRVSLRRDKDLISVSEIPEERREQRAIIDSASRATLVLSLFGHKRMIDSAFCSMLCSSSFRVRLIVLAESPEHARRVLPAETVQQMPHVWLRPLEFRSQDIPLLMDQALADEGSALRSSQLTPANFRALQAYGWPDNLDEVRRIARELALLATMGTRPASEQLGLSKTGLRKHLAKVGLEFPLFSRDDRS